MLNERTELKPDLDLPTIDALRPVGRRMFFCDGDHLYRQGDPARQVFVLLEGAVKATSGHSHGLDTLLKIHRPGSLLGLSALRPDGLRDANGIAVGQIDTLCIARRAFLKHMNEEAAIGLTLVRILLRRQQELHGRMRALLGNSVEQRLAAVLLQLQAEAAALRGAETPTEIAITHEDLASMVISRRQYVTQILRSFVAKDLILSKRKRIRVLDPDNLRMIADT